MSDRHGRPPSRIRTRPTWPPSPRLRRVPPKRSRRRKVGPTGCEGRRQYGSRESTGAAGGARARKASNGRRG